MIRTRYLGRTIDADVVDMAPVPASFIADEERVALAAAAVDASKFGPVVGGTTVLSERRPADERVAYPHYLFWVFLDVETNEEPE